MDEFSFIKSIAPSAYQQSSIIKGIGDDAAVFRPSGQDVVTAVDTMVNGIHFSLETMEPYHIGYRALAANISDLAAMGSVPAFYLVSVVVPPEWSSTGLEELYRGMKDLAAQYRMDVIGGDTVSGSELSVSITVIGYVDRDKARYRSAARAGDVVFVTGTLGDSRAGLECLLKGSTVNDEEKTFLIHRHRMPEPRASFAQALHDIKRLALNDISDGMANESNEIAEASEMDIHLEKEQIPFTPSVKEFFPDHYDEWMLTGGEDFELMGTVSEEEWPEVIKAADRVGVKVSRVGIVKEKQQDNPTVYLHDQKTKKIVTKTGYTHLTKKGE
ncbi:thiamine-phosphate kinase [Halobacillus mangrovi]|uniref:thiamine-phosphate kinase n=1 Tax=Halobacillus mangrovi TaxID=402384 RepID=UPI003D966784